MTLIATFICTGWNTWKAGPGCSKPKLSEGEAWAVRGLLHFNNHVSHSYKWVLIWNHWSAQGPEDKLLLLLLVARVPLNVAPFLQISLGSPSSGLHLPACRLHLAFLVHQDLGWQVTPSGRAHSLRSATLWRWSSASSAVREFPIGSILSWSIDAVHVVRIFFRSTLQRMNAVEKMPPKKLLASLYYCCAAFANR